MLRVSVRCKESNCMFSKITLTSRFHDSMLYLVFSSCKSKLRLLKTVLLFNDNPSDMDTKIFICVHRFPFRIMYGKMEIQSAAPALTGPLALSVCLQSS